MSVISKGVTFALVIFCSVTLVYAQEKMRKLENPITQFANQPVEIVSRTLGSENIAEDGTFTAGQDWIRQLRFTVKNVSVKKIVFIEVGLIVERTERAPIRVVFPMRFGAPFWIGTDGRGKISDRNQLLLPQQTAVVSVSESTEKALRELLKRYDADDLKGVIVEVQEVQFDNDTGWSLGYEWRRDPTNRNKKLRLDETKLEREGLWQKVTDFFFAKRPEMVDPSATDSFGFSLKPSKPAAASTEAPTGCIWYTGPQVTGCTISA